MENVNKSESCRVLLAEDNKINQKLMLLMLGKLGVSTDVANNGAEAVEKAAGGTYDLVLMDLHMPIMDGLEATRKLHEQMGESAPPVVALTADAMGSTNDEAFGSGMKGYLTKPVSADQLKACIGKYTGITL